MRTLFKVVNWNGSPRATTFVTGSQLTATILASDIASPSTASVTMFNPAPGGGTNAVYFEVTRATASVAMLRTDFPSGKSSDNVIAGDFNWDGNLDVAVLNGDPTNTVSILLGNGDGSFRPLSSVALIGTCCVTGMTTADFNADGKLDLAVSDGSNQVLSSWATATELSRPREPFRPGRIQPGSSRVTLTGTASLTWQWQMKSTTPFLSCSAMVTGPYSP